MHLLRDNWVESIPTSLESFELSHQILWRNSFIIIIIIFHYIYFIGKTVEVYWKGK